MEITGSKSKAIGAAGSNALLSAFAHRRARWRSAAHALRPFRRHSMHQLAGIEPPK
jgi:hypothetical protein